MRGRKPKPTHLRLIEGNRGRRPPPLNEPKPRGNLQTPPGWFTDQQREVWRYAIESAPPGLLKLLDREVLAIWCVASEIYQRAIEAQSRIDAVGGLQLLTKTPEGHLVQSPYLPIINKQAAIMLKAASELGFTPSSRTRVSVDPSDAGSQDPAQEFLGA